MYKYSRKVGQKSPVILPTQGGTTRTFAGFLNSVYGADCSISSWNQHKRYGPSAANFREDTSVKSFRPSLIVFMAASIVLIQTSPPSDKSRHCFKFAPSHLRIKSILQHVPQNSSRLMLAESKRWVLTCLRFRCVVTNHWELL